MRLIVECEHGHLFSHRAPLGLTCAGGYRAEGPDAILAALAEAGVLYRRYEVRGNDVPVEGYVYQSPGWWPWKESE